MPFASAHDFLEGIPPYVLSALIMKFVRLGYFTLGDLNELIDDFEYSRLDDKVLQFN